jgi:4-amino-4-deoxy-L-arabinose transferase-like glycosyltransferase
LRQTQASDKAYLRLSLALHNLWRNRRVRWVPILFLVALVPRLVWVLYAHSAPVGLHDPVFYDSLAHGVAAGEGYLNPYTGEPTAYFPPGYPFALAALYFVFGHHIIVAELFNVFIGAATVVITYELAHRLAGHSVALVAGLMLAFFPSQVFYTVTLLSEVLFTLLLMGGLLVLLARPWREEGIGWGRLVAAGFLFGAAALVRPIALLIPGVLFVYWIFGSSRLRAAVTRAAVVALPMALLILPWTVRNLITMDSFILISTNAGDNFCIGNHEGATGSFVFSGPCYEGYEHISDPVEREVESYREGIRRGLEFIINNPTDEMGLLMEKAYALVRADDDGLRAAQSYDDDPFIDEDIEKYLSTAANAYYFIAIGWATLGLVSWFRPRDGRRTLSLLVVGYVLAVPLLFFTDERFHFPAIPLLTIIAAVGAVAIWQARKSPWQTEALEAGQEGSSHSTAVGVPAATSAKPKDPDGQSGERGVGDR